MHIRSLIFLFCIAFPLSCGKNGTPESVVMSGYFRSSIIETGELEAVKASFITMPRVKWEYGYRFKLIGMAGHGTTVNQGDSVVALDPSSIYRYIIQREETLEKERAAANKQMAEMENTIQNLNAQLKSEQAMFALKKLELEKIQFESESIRRIKELEYQQAVIRLDKVKNSIESKIKQEELESRIHRIKVGQREAEIKDAGEALKMLTLLSENQGVFQVARNRWSRQQVRLGDELYFGQQIASIPDLTRMKVLSQVNETDISKRRTGMSVIVRLDALPSVPFKGIVTFVSKICLNRDDKNIFLTEVEIAESDIRLKPGMTVSCEYIYHETENGIFVPNNCILKEKEGSWIFPSVKAGAKVEVVAGPSDNNHTLILSPEIEPGEKLIPVSLTDHVILMKDAF
jgi:HlyD family secretion protein